MTTDSPNTSTNGEITRPPVNKHILQNQFSIESVQGGSGTRRRRTTSGGGLHRQSSLSLHHWDSYKVIKKDVDEALEEHPDDVIKTKVPWWTSHRVRLSFLCFMGFFCLYANRVNLSVAIICMVKQELTNDTSVNTQSFVNETAQVTFQSNNYVPGLITPNRSFENHHIEGPEVSVCPTSAWSSRSQPGEFEWDKFLRGFLLGGFFWGYTIMQIPAGWMAERYGPRETVFGGMFLVSTLTLLTPLLARGSPYLLLIGRVLIGVGEAMMYPGAQVLWAKWAPPQERSRLVGFSFGGCQLGNALAFPVASLLCQYGFDGGWPAIFYVLGGLALIWTFVWLICVRNTPAEKPGISEREVRYIESSLGCVFSTKNSVKKKHLIPWKAMLTSLPVWSILVANFCGNYGAYMLLTQMPTYMKEVLHFDIKSNGVFSMIPYIVFWIFVVIAALFADFFISRNILSIEWTRKLCGSIGMFVPAVFLIAVGYMDCFHQIEAVALLTLSLAFCGFQFASFFVNHADIAPKYAGTIFGITNTGASVPGILAPYVVSAITQNKTPAEWRVAFYIAAAIYTFGGIFYIVFAKGRIQPWASDEEDDDDEDVKLKDFSENTKTLLSNEDKAETNGKRKT
ncbi:sialin-like [Ylistrum balloti]|uniref:sialin-like n=1 Tax=Ylistrum balloti TaxID=509963 RepID=UPI002905ABF5|nr:sialin-like [Ylistrum balloti]